MSKTIELRKIIQTELKTKCEKVYFQTAPSNVSFPYLVYDINSVSIDTRDNGVLTVDIWDRNSDTSIIETLTDDIEKQLDFKTFNNDKIQAAFFISIRNNIVDEDKKLSRRQLKFNIQYYSKED